MKRSARSVVVYAKSKPPSTLELAAKFHREREAVLAAQPSTQRYGSGGLPIPQPGVVRRAARVSDARAVKTADGYRRMQAEKKGYDSGVGKPFETVAQAREYRKLHGVVEMSPSEFSAEVGGPSGPSHSDLMARVERRFPASPVVIGGQVFDGSELTIKSGRKAV